MAVRVAEGPDPEARRQRLERRLSESLERWVAGEWRYYELVSRVAPVVGELHEMDRPAIEEHADSEDSRRQLLLEWDALDEGERTALLRAVLAEAVVDGKTVRVTRRR